MTVGRTDGEQGERLLILSRSVYNATDDCCDPEREVVSILLSKIWIVKFVLHSRQQARKSLQIEDKMSMTILSKGCQN